MIAVLRWVLGLGGVVVGLFLFVLAVTVGDCAAFGGRCPSEGVEGDVLGMAATGAGLAVGLPIVARGWSRRALPAAVVAAASAGAVGALLAWILTRS